MITYKAYCYKLNYYDKFDKHPSRPKSYPYGFEPWRFSGYYEYVKLSNQLQQLKRVM